MAVGTRDLALYGAIIATLNGLWSLYHNVWRDRPRVRLRAYEAKTLESVVKSVIQSSPLTYRTGAGGPSKS